MTPSPLLRLGLAALAALAAAPAQTRTGVDVIAADGCAALRGRKVGLITNHTGRTADGRRTVDVIAAGKDVELTALFSPEHGWQGVLDEKVGDTVDAGPRLGRRCGQGRQRCEAEPEDGRGAHRCKLPGRHLREHVEPADEAPSKPEHWRFAVRRSRPMDGPSEDPLQPLTRR